MADAHMPIHHAPGVTLASVVAAVLLAGAPMARADPQDGSQQCPGQNGANGAGTDQQCQGQGDPARRAVDEAKDAADQAQKQQQQRQAKKDPMSQGLLYLVNGVPTCLHGGDVLTNVTVTPAIPPQTC